MNYFNLVKNIQDTALKHQFVQEFFEGDVYDIMNTQDRKYPTVILTTERIDDTNGYQTITASLFCIDRLTSDGVNKLEVQSICQTILQGILLKLESAYPEMTIQTESFVPFTEKFKDLCAGMYVECSLSYPSMICDDEVFTTKEIILESNGIYDVIGYDRAIVNVRPVVNLEDITITDNGTYTPSAGFDGFGTVNVDLKGKVKVGSFKVSNSCINSEGEWEYGKLIDTSECTSFNRIFWQNTKIKKIDISNWNTDKATDLDGMFGWASKLTEIIGVEKLINTKPTKVSQMFVGNRPITVIDFIDWDMSNLVKNGLNNFADSWKLQSCVGGRTVEEVIENDIKVFNGLKITVNTLFNSGTIDRASLRAIINGLADLTGQTTQTLTLGNTLRAKLTEEDIAIATAKNWTIA